jgi:ABC-type sugar transport system ATPase subunit
MNSKNFAEIKQIEKEFPGVKALDKVSFDIPKGKIIGLVGENGAGKSTLIKILAGVYTDYEGDLIIEGKKVLFNTPTDAQNMGIATIFQELTIVPTISVAENILLGREPLWGGAFVNKRKLHKLSREALRFIGIDIKPRELASNLSIANRQVIEICKALALDAKIIVMDEPSSSLTRLEVDRLFEVIGKLKESGKSIIYVSHRLEEIFDICDRVEVLRDGKLVGSRDIKETNQEEIINLMVGRSIKTMYPYQERTKGDIALSVKNFTKQGQFYDVSFELREGEIIGLSGLVGAGRTEVAKAIIGLTKPDNGELVLYNKSNPLFKHPRTALNNGLSYLPEDRKTEGILTMLKVGENISISALSQCSKHGIIYYGLEKELVEHYFKSLNIKATSHEQIIDTLSGGNQQKAIISRLLANKSKILIFDEPTHGVDVGAKYEIYNIMNELASEGKAIIFISSELPELIGISDRLLLFRRGRLVKEFNRGETGPEQIMKILTGSNC